MPPRQGESAKLSASCANLRGFGCDGRHLEGNLAIIAEKEGLTREEKPSHPSVALGRSADAACLRRLSPGSPQSRRVWAHPASLPSPYRNGRTTRNRPYG